MNTVYLKFKRWVHSRKLYPLPCNGMLCPWRLNLVHPSCLICRHRRKAYCSWKEPKRYILYTYRGSVKQISPGMLQAYSTQVDPRGKFLHFRLSAIKIVDACMPWVLWRPNGYGRPLTEVCEFLANYPM
jgi:hypothetical protein